MDNYDLETYRWEDDIIYDPNNMPKIPSKFLFLFSFKNQRKFSAPRILTLDYEDEPKLYGIPEDRMLEDRMEEEPSGSQPKPFDRKVGKN